MGALYQALLSAGASEDLAREAAGEAAAYHLELLRTTQAPKIQSHLPAIPLWILKVLFAINVLMQAIVFALIVAMLAR